MAGGRQTKFTKDRVDECLRLLRLGLPKQDAAALAGFAPGTLASWLRDGEADQVQGRKTTKADFYVEVRKAEAAFKLNATVVVVNAANGRPAEYDDDGNKLRTERQPNWQAATWMLERRFPDEYSPRREITGVGGGPLEVEVATIDVLVARVRALRPVHDPLAIDSPPPTNGTHG